MAVSFISYQHSMNALKSKTESYNMAMVEQAQQVIDEKMRSIDQLLLDASLNPRIQRFLYEKKPITHSDIYSMKIIIDDIVKYRNTNPLVEQLYVYFHNTDVILINSGKHTCEFFYEEISPYADMTYREWQQLLNQNNYKRYLPEKTLKLNNKKVITCLQSLPFGTKREILGTIGILINTQYIKNILNNIHLDYQGAMYIINQNGEVIIETGSTKFSYHISSLNLPVEEHKGYYYDTIGNQKVLVTYIPSEYNEWKYISIIPISVFMNDLNAIKSIAVIIMVGGVILGVILSYLLARKNYTPIKVLVEKLQNSLSNIPKDIKNEIAFIEKVTATTVRENQQIRNILSEQQPLIRSNLLIQLLKGTIKEGSSDAKSLQTFGIQFPYLYFCVLLIHIDDCSQFAMNDSIEEYSLTKLVIANIVEELLSKHYTVYTVDLSTIEIALIVNLNAKSADWKAYIQDIAAKSREILNREFSIFISIGIGTRHAGMVGISKSYNEAVQAMEYKMVKGKSSIIFFDEISEGFGQSYYYPLDIEKQLQNSIRAGDKEKACDLLKQIVTSNFIKSSLPLEIARCLFFDIMSTVLKILDNISDDYPYIVDKEYDEIRKLTECSTIDEMINIIDGIFDKICFYVNENKKSNNDVLKHKIIKFIDDHFMENNISLSMIAHALDITPTYLSSFFKEQTGENILDYINNMRINKAKELLIETSLNLSSIAENVGYTNEAVLIRNFKKYEGITPGQYRRSHSKKSIILS